MFIKRIYFLIIFWNFPFTFSQNLQISKVSYVKIDIPIIGIINVNLYETITDGFYKKEEKTKAERVPFRWTLGDYEGEIMILGTNKILKYNLDDEEYWTEDAEEYFKKIQSEKTKENDNSLSFSFDSDEDSGTLSIDRNQASEFANIHGYKAKKWTTTFSKRDGKIVVEEWFVDRFPLLKLYDSLKTKMISSFRNDSSHVENNFSEIKSDIIISEIDSVHSIKPIPGYPVKTNLFVFDDDSKQKFGMGYEILELYAEMADTAFFTIPEKYNRIEKSSK